MSHNLEISLFGPCVVRSSNGPELRGAKHKAFAALLAVSPLGRRTRAYLQNTLWGASDYDSGHQNLRRALSDIKKVLGADFDRFFQINKSDIEVDINSLRLLGGPEDGAFLEDLNIKEKGFADWLQDTRANLGPIKELFSLPEKNASGRLKPKVTALPLSVIGSDPDLRIMGDWIAEEICRSLSRSNLLDVVSHLSGRAMAAQLIDIFQVRKTLDVDFLTTGTLRRTGSEYLVDIDFVDAEKGTIIWNRHLSCPVANFADNLHGHLNNTIQSIGRAIADLTIDYVRGQTLENVEDHKLVIAGVSLMHRSRMRDFVSSREYLEEAIARMPKSADIHAWLGKWYVLSVFKGLTTNRDSDTQKALDSTARALDIDPHSSFSLTIDGFANNNLLKEMHTAEKRYNQALEVNPNESLSWLLRGTLMAFQDDGLAAVRAAEHARRLSPIDPFGYYYDSLSSTAYLAAENYQKALEFADRSLLSNDRHISTLRAKITALHHLDRPEEARACAAEMMRKFPAFSLQQYKKEHPSAQHSIGLRAIEALERAGLE